MRILLAGTTGVIGRQAVPVRAAGGHQVTGLARDMALTNRLRTQDTANLIAAADGARVIAQGIACSTMASCPGTMVSVAGPTGACRQ